ncbi:MAG: Smr/MutS family protein [Hyphomicrobiaceae bacterium]
MAKKRKSPPKASSRKLDKQHPIEDDTALWEAFTRHIDPVELKGRVPHTESDLLDSMLRRERARTAPLRESQPGKPGKQTIPKRAVAQPPPQPPAPQPNHMDGRSVRRIGSGRDGIDARIDLHGMRQNEAHSALRVFLFRAVAKGHRMVLVITGKGRPRTSSDGALGPFVHEGTKERGILRRNVPLWLAEPDLRAIVVGHTPAHIRHGGDGALYVQLRRRRLP